MRSACTQVSAPKVSGELRNKTGTVALRSFTRQQFYHALRYLEGAGATG
jgi:hypothetical protein